MFKVIKNLGLVCVVLSVFAINEANASTDGAKEINEAEAKKVANSIQMVKVEGGSFVMGNAKGYPNEQPEHEVSVSTFYISKMEVTQAEYEAIMGVNPSVVKGANLPVTNVNFDEAMAFIQKLKELTGQNFRLPTEAEWEFAARGGNKSRGYMVAGNNDPSNVSWFRDNSGKSIKPVGKKNDNELGIHDMSGNVWEWTNDWFDPNFYASSPSKDPKGPAQGNFKVLRGGSSSDAPNAMRVSGRFSSFPQVKSGMFGIRLVKS